VRSQSRAEAQSRLSAVVGAVLRDAHHFGPSVKGYQPVMLRRWLFAVFDDDTFPFVVFA
jgi:hypothetical protein